MTIESIIVMYGYPAIFIGTFLEGETVLVLGGLAAHLGYLHLPGVMGAAFAGSLMGDQAAFHLGRRFGKRLLEKRPVLRVRVAQVNLLMARFRIGIVLGFRFIYGLRNVIPFTLGISPISSVRFLLLNIAGAFLWVALVGTGGYFFGKAMEVLLGELKRYEGEMLAIMAACGVAFWLLNHVHSHRKDRSVRK